MIEKILNSKIYYLLSVIIVTTSFFVIGFFFNINDNDSDILIENESLMFVPSYDDSSQVELVLIYLGSSTCGYCSTPELSTVLDKIKIELQKRASNLGVGFNAIGVAIDYDVNAGIRHLKNKGKFNEVLVGNNWSGIGLDRYIWSKHEGVAATPQIIVAERTYNKKENTKTGNMKLGIENEKVLQRKSGLTTIEEWYKFGMSMPKLK